MNLFFTLLFGALLLTACSPNYDSFAKCLSEKNTLMYGASWCPHCQAQKEKFGSSVEYINYIECAVPSNPSKQTAACEKANITGYPTWVFENNERMSGEVSFEVLKEKSGCALPQ